MAKKKTSASRSKASHKGQYKQPGMRERLKEEIKDGAKGGKPGQWSARKAQLLASEYKKKGGEYTSEKQAPQKHLDAWTEQKWKTADGKKAQRKGGTTRYLPEKAWSELSDEEKRETSDKKQSGSRHGKQFVSNTVPAKKARKKAATQKATRKVAAKKTAKKATKKKATRKSAASATKKKSTAQKGTSKKVTKRQASTTRPASKKAKTTAKRPVGRPRKKK